MIHLEPIGRDEYDRVAHIRVTPEQEPFCGTIAGHFASEETGCDFHAVTRGALPVGFFKIDREYPSRFDFAAEGELGLRAVMIDRAEQGRGSGKAAMLALGPYLARHYPAAGSCVLTVNVVNPAARAIYLAGGFVDDGALYHGGRIGPQHILRLRLPKLAVA
ncbi:GNAT family N-acetyltransferase [Paracoccus sp. KR1-242]|uniref:GNAT family N-acetyltransferase n=1 Tax=Paracoccus sp. KR1-242 TaxID=3410028 RepID=UPI003C11C4B2